MRQNDRALRLQILLGVGGVFVTLVLWRCLAPVLAPRLSGWAMELVNAFAGCTLALVPLLIEIRRKDNPGDLGLTRRALGYQVLTGIALGLGLGAVLALVPMALGMKELVFRGAGYGSLGEALLGLVYFLLCVGLPEEFVFRGFLYEKLKEISFSDWVPTVVSSLLFGLLHIRGLHIMGTLMPGLLGVFFCVCKEKVPQRSLLSLAIAHGLYDWLIRVLAGIF